MYLGQFQIKQFLWIFPLGSLLWYPINCPICVSHQSVSEWKPSIKDIGKDIGTSSRRYVQTQRQRGPLNTKSVGERYDGVSAYEIKERTGEALLFLPMRYQPLILVRTIKGDRARLCIGWWRGRIYISIIRFVFRLSLTYNYVLSHFPRQQPPSSLLLRSYVYRNFHHLPRRHYWRHCRDCRVFSSAADYTNCC